MVAQCVDPGATAIDLVAQKLPKKKKLHTTLKLFVMGSDGIKVDLASVDLQNELRPKNPLCLYIIYSV